MSAVVLETARSLGVDNSEELFLIEHRDDGTTMFTIEAFSRPATRLARLGGPVTRRIQLALTNRYLRAAG